VYLNFWPESVDTMGAFPAATMERNRARTLQIQAAAARAAIASRTVAPLSSFDALGANIQNDAKNALKYLHTAGHAAPQTLQPDPVGVAPQVVPLNENAWGEPGAAAVCSASNPFAGAPWADAGMYRSVAPLGGPSGKTNWVRLGLFGLVAGFGLYTLGKK
jgi:hypothetical protein